VERDGAGRFLFVHGEKHVLRPSLYRGKQSDLKTARQSPRATEKGKEKKSLGRGGGRSALTRGEKKNNFSQEEPLRARRVPAGRLAGKKDSKIQEEDKMRFLRKKKIEILQVWGKEGAGMTPKAPIGITRRKEEIRGDAAAEGERQPIAS